MANVKVGAYNFIVIGLIAILFIVLAKMIFSKWQVPGVTELVHAA